MPTLSASRRLVLLALPALVLLLLVLAAGLAVARAVFLPPLPNTRFVAFDGLQVRGGCLDGILGPRRGRVWQCKWDVHLDSRFEILAHDPAAVEWCARLVRDGAAANLRTARLNAANLGAATLGPFPPVWGGWAGCGHLIPLSVGFYFDLSINH